MVKKFLSGLIIEATCENARGKRRFSHRRRRSLSKYTSSFHLSVINDQINDQLCYVISCDQIWSFIFVFILISFKCDKWPNKWPIVMWSLIPMTKFGHLSRSFQFSFFPVTKSGHLSWLFLVSSLKVTNFGHLSLKKNSGDQIFWSPGH